jgi:hypothetical protein
MLLQKKTENTFELETTFRGEKIVKAFTGGITAEVTSLAMTKKP